jgi:hypothetical protein
VVGLRGENLPVKGFGLRQLARLMMAQCQFEGLRD